MPPLSTTSESRLPELRGAAHRWISFWRGKFDRSSGTITLDRTAKTGSLDITIAASSVDFGHWQLNEHAKGPNLFDVSEFPTLRRAPIDPERERERMRRPQPPFLDRGRPLQSVQIYRRAVDL